MTTQTQTQPDASNAQADSDTTDAPVSLENTISAAFDKVDAQDQEPVDTQEDGIEEDTAEIDAEEAAKAANDAEDATDDTKEEKVEPEATEETLAAPERFTASAKAEWDKAPESVRKEILRMQTELEGGISGYKEKMEAYEGLDDFAAMAKESGTSLKAAMAHYSGLEDIFRKDPMAGFNQIAQNMGLSMHQVAAHVLNQSPNQQAMQSSQQVSNLQKEITALKAQVETVNQTFTKQNETALQGEINAFKTDNPHFETVREDMALLLESERANDLQSAYDLAVKMHGIEPIKTPSNEGKQKDDLKAQTRKGKLSVDGAPGAGSNPDNAKPPKSAREAVDRAFASIA